MYLVGVGKYANIKGVPFDAFEGCVESEFILKNL
jgi:hypothetical protein